MDKMVAGPIAGNGKDVADQPRIPPLQMEDITDDRRQFLLRMLQLGATTDSADRRQAAGYNPSVDDLQRDDLAPVLGNMPDIMRTMLHHPRLFTLLAEVGLQLLGDGVLPPRARELAILRIAWLCQAPYAWGEHVILAKKAGIPSAEIERVTEGASASGWSDHERAILCVTDELFNHATVSDATWDLLQRQFNHQQLIELIVVVGQYQAAAYYQNALRLRLLNGNIGLEAR